MKFSSNTAKRLSTFADVFLDMAAFMAGSALYSFSFCYFIEPNQISPGGITGIAAIINYVFSLPTGVMVFLLNLPVLIFGMKKIGGKFILKTIVVTIMISVMLDIFGIFVPEFSGDRLLAALFGGVLSGSGLALVMLRGATTGGVDVIAKIVRIKHPFLSMGRLILIMDGIVVLLAAVCYRNIETALFTVIELFASSKVIDAVLYGSDKGRMLIIITNNGEEVSNRLFKEIKRGITLVPVKGGYLKKDRQMLICALRTQEAARAVATVKNTDPNAFTIVTLTGSILGYGFESDIAM